MSDQNDGLRKLQYQLESALVAVDRLAVKDILMGIHPDMNDCQYVESLVVPALENIGNAWENGKYSLSQVYMSGRICEEVVDLILPPAHADRRHQPKTAIVVLDDYHFLGKRIVYSVLRASGFELENYNRMGVDELVTRVVQEKVKVLLISVLMLPSALRVKELRRRLEQNGYPLKIAVGGAPFRFDTQLWREVGADACGVSAADAVSILHRIIDEGR